MPTRTISVAAIQFRAEPGEIERNLQRMDALVAQAVGQGAQLVLLPELAPGGYLLTEEIWKSAETMRGRSVAWLKAAARQHGIYLGMSFLEADGADFYNSFVLAAPSGDIAGRVRKNPPASAEAYFYRAGSDAHCIDTELGRIGVSICYEAILHARLAEHHANGVDLVLVPMSAGTPTRTFPLRRKDCVAFDAMLLGLAAHHARVLGVPVVMANKCGPLVTDMPSGFPHQDTRFPGLSTIADAGGSVIAQLGSEEGVITGEVRLDPSKKVAAAPRSHGHWALPVPWYSFLFPLAAYFGTSAYAKSKVRPQKALAVCRKEG